MDTKLFDLAVATNGEVYTDKYGWMYDAVTTFETIENFVDASNNWAECSKDKFGEIAGMKFVAWTNCQVKKGQQRGSKSVIDFGDFRICIDCDLTDYV